MKPIKFTLTKCSGEGWYVETDNLVLIYEILSDRICDSCLEDEDFPKDAIFNSMTTADQVNELLSTPCGCEYHFEVESPYHLDDEYNLLIDKDGLPTPKYVCLCAARSVYECACGAWDTPIPDEDYTITKEAH